MNDIKNSRLMRTICSLLAIFALSATAVAAQETKITGKLAEWRIPNRPLTLEDCLDIALQLNPQMDAVEQTLVSAEAGLTRARSPYYPQLSLSLVDRLVNRRVATFPEEGDSSGITRQSDIELGLRQVFWRHGLSESVAESRSSLDAVQFDYHAFLQSLIETVATDYYSVLANEQLVEVAREGVEASRGHLDLMRARIELGAAAQVDIYPAEDDLARAELDLIDARSNLRLAIARLKNTMGLPAEIPIELAPAPAPWEREPPALEEALRVARERRPDLRAANSTLEAREYGLHQARIRRGPLTEVSGSAVQAYTDWESRDPVWQVLLSISWPLFDGQATRADVVAARAAMLRAEAERQRTENAVGLEVETALAVVERFQERLRATDTSVAAAQARLSAAEGRYREGLAIPLEVTEARAALTNALAGQVRARYDYEISLVGLERAIGALSFPLFERTAPSIDTELSSAEEIIDQ